MKEIEKALAQAWAKFPTIGKDKTNEFAKFNYASLTQIESTIKPALVEHGLRLFYRQRTEGDSVCVRACVIHSESCEMIESDELIMRVRGKKADAPTTPQDLMSAITYLKRYSVVGLLGLSTDDADIDDMNPADFHEPQKQNRQQTKVQPQSAVAAMENPEDKQEKARQECIKLLRGYVVSHGEDTIKRVLGMEDLGLLKKLDLKSLTSAKRVVEKALANTTAPIMEQMDA